MKVLFHPHVPIWEDYTIHYVLRRLGWSATADVSEPFDLAIVWEDLTYVERDDGLARLAGGRPVWNLECSDISKRRVEREFARVFGRTTFVDPFTWSGACVEKRDRNEPLDRGRMVTCPVDATRDGFVYRRFIDTLADGRSLDIRLPVVRGRIRHALLFERVFDPEAVKSPVSRASVEDPAAVLSPEEIAGILDICRSMHLDYGEVDALRDRADGQIYVLDVNKTPMLLPPGPRWRSETDCERAVAELSALVREAVGAE